MGKICEHCGAKIVEYKHSISKGLISCLDLISKREGPVNLNELGFNYNQQSNFQKLRYWDLVRKSDPKNVKGGEWVITEKGLNFIKKIITLPKSVWTFRGEPVRYEGEAIFVDQVKESYKTRKEYISECVSR